MSTTSKRLITTHLSRVCLAGALTLANGQIAFGSEPNERTLPPTQARGVAAKDTQADIPRALSQRDFKTLDEALNGMQRRFEAGEVDEVNLRNAYRPFYNLSPQQSAALQEWPKRNPKSYAAHLALGIYLKKAGSLARGEQWISETSPEQLKEMRQLLAKSNSELRKSEPLTAKPYLSIFHLLDITESLGKRDEALRLVKKANQLLPGNRLARNRYVHSLTPRWGGSYSQIQAFIETSKKEGVDQEGLAQMSAVMFDDMGHTAWTDKAIQKACEHFTKALELAKTTNKTFKDDWLRTTTRFMSLYEKDKEVCK